MPSLLQKLISRMNEQHLTPQTRSPNLIKTFPNERGEMFAIGVGAHLFIHSFLWIETVALQHFNVADSIRNKKKVGLLIKR